MDFAADAVFDVMAPPVRQPASARSTPPDSSGPRFDDHLEAVVADDEIPHESKPVESEKSETTETSGSEPEVAAEPAPAPVAPTPVVQPHIIQIVETATPATSQGAESEIEPTAAAPAAPSEATPAPQAADAPEPVAPEAKPAVDAKSAERVAAPVAKQATPDDKPQAAAPHAPTTPPQAQPQPPAPQMSAAATPEATEAPPPEAASAAAQLIASERPAPPPRLSKAEPSRDAKAGATPAEARVDAPATSTPSAQKSAHSNNTGKDALPAALAIQADAVEPSALPPLSDGTPFTQLTAQTHQAASVGHAAAARAAPAATQVAQEIVRRFNGESTRFELRLDPPELGRVDVRLEVSRDNRVSAVIAADSPQALTELSRHARDLEQMLNDAGLQLSDSGLSFDLRQGSENAGGDNERHSRTRVADGGDAAQQQTPTPARPLGFERWRGVRVDVMV